jgi:hypothetical protein
MAQHDYVIDNGTGLAVRADINSLAGAIVTLNGGTSAPSVTFAHMFWYDETAAVLKIRNSANSAWLAFEALISSGTITLAKLADIATDSLIGRDTAASGVPEVIGVTGGIEFNGSGSIRVGAFTGGDVDKAAGSVAPTINSNAVTNAKLADMATTTIKGRVSGGTGDPEDLSASQAKTVLSLNNVDNTSDATYSASTVTLTNKRITKRVTSIASNATPTINTDNCDAVDITALAVAITSMTTNLSGTPTNFQQLTIRFKDNGTARAIAWGTGFEAAGVALPTTTVISKRLTVGFIYDTTTSKWGCVASVQEA